PKIKSIVRCTDGVAGEVSHVIADPLTLEVSHIVVKSNGVERQVPVSTIRSADQDTVELTCKSEQLADFPAFIRLNFLSSKEVEIPHLEDSIHAEPGEVFVPFPE